MQAHGWERVYETGLRILGYPVTWVIRADEARPLIAAMAAGE